MIGRVKNQGGGQARYFGRAKTLAQLLWTAALVNFKQIWNRTTAQPAQIAAAAAMLFACLLVLSSPSGKHPGVAATAERQERSHVSQPAHPLETLTRAPSAEVDESLGRPAHAASPARKRTPSPLLLDAALVSVPSAADSDWAASGVTAKRIWSSVMGFCC